MSDAPVKCLLVADFNAANLAALLENSPEAPQMNCVVAPFQTGPAALLDRESELARDSYAAALIWTRPEAVSEAFKRLTSGRPATDEEILSDVDGFLDLILGSRVAVGLTFVCTWTMPPQSRGLGLRDLKRGGLARALMIMNTRLTERLESESSVYVLDAQRWVALCGRTAFTAKGWFMGKIPFAMPVFKEASLDLKAALRSSVGQIRKVIAVDLDNTLWGGIVGEAGWQALRLGGHDPIGEAFQDFQGALKSLKQRGVLLTILSRNDPAPVWEAFRSHPEMVLRPEDFVAWRINWEDKASNLVSMADEIGLGLDAFVFLDDDPTQRARVREALPDVLVPEWPRDTMLYTEALWALRCFEVAALSEEDRARTDLYQSERHRKSAKVSAKSMNDWLQSLETVVHMEALNEGNLDRTAQLLNKTNQMNLSTRRLTAQELRAWASEPNRQVLTFRVGDRFGSVGLVGVASVELLSTTARVVDYVVSCRVLGRGVEEVMIGAAVNSARALGADRLEARYLATPRNKPCLDLWKKSRFQYDEASHTFDWATDSEYEPPQFVRVEPPSLLPSRAGQAHGEEIFAR